MIFHALLLLSACCSRCAILFIAARRRHVSRGLPVLRRARDRLPDQPDLSSNPAKAGVGQGIFGTLLLASIVAVVAFPSAS